MNKKNTMLWSLSLLIISIVTVIWTVCNIVEYLNMQAEKT